MSRLCALAILMLLAACRRAPEPETAPVDSATAGLPAKQSQDSLNPPAPPAATSLLQDSLLGAWSADGQNFVWVIEKAAILFESDMLLHPYTISGDTILIDRQDPAIGVQKTRVLRLQGDTLVIEDVMSGNSEKLLRLR